jgi:hypothetical protein
MSQLTLREVVEKHRRRIMKIPGVVGIGVGGSGNDPGTRCVHVYVQTQDWPAELPRTLGSYPVEIVKTRKGFHAL